MSIYRYGVIFLITLCERKKEMEKKDLFETTVDRLVGAMRYYNFTLMDGSFSQWQVALAKYETLRDLLIDCGHTFKYVAKTEYVGTSSRMLFMSVFIDGVKYEIPEYQR